MEFVQFSNFLIKLLDRVKYKNRNRNKVPFCLPESVWGVDKKVVSKDSPSRSGMLDLQFPNDFEMKKCYRFVKLEKFV